MKAQLVEGDRWFILSAQHHLVPPDEVIAPYDLTLNRMRSADRAQWAATVLEQLSPYLPATDEVIFLAGSRYRKHLEGAIRDRGIDVKIPMTGLSIGRQLQWLSRHLEAAA